MALFGSQGYEGIENKLWFEGKGDKLEYFYKNVLPFSAYNSQDRFWRAVNTRMPRAHYPLPGTISRAMGTLLFNQVPEFTVDAGSKARNKLLQQRLDEILDTNDILVLLQTAAAYQSYSGQVGLKINYDPTISDDPLITIYPKERIETHKKYGKIVYIDFIDKYEDDYKLVSRYGLGYINYMLFKGDKRVPLNSFDQTAGLEDVAFFDKEGNILPVMFATVVNNRGMKDDSDYKGLIDTFHALDEAYSALNNYIRKTKPNIFITEDIAPKDASGKTLPFNEFDNIIKVLDQSFNTDGSSNTRIDRDIVKLEVQGYIDAINKYRLIALETIGLSPATLGIDSGGANQSGEALNIRERASGRLRGEKLANWKEQLDKFFYSVLVFDYAVKNAVDYSKGIYILELPHDFKVISNFGEYVEETLKDRSETYLKLYEKGLISVDFAITQIFGDSLSEEELVRLIIETKTQNQIPLNEAELAFIEKNKPKAS